MFLTKILQNELFPLISILLILCVCNFILSIILFKQLKREREHKHRLEKHFSGQNTEDLMMEMFSEHDKIFEEIKHLKKRLKEQENKQKSNIDKMEVVRFNAGNGNDAKLSYTIGFSNEQQDGIILTALHYRDRMNLYVKHIKEGVADVPLSDQEQAALDRSKLGKVMN